jgi:serine/threonine protein kinase
MWAAGIGVYELLTNSHPFFRGTETTQEKRDYILGFEKLEFPSKLPISPQARHLLERMVCKEQSHRYSAAEILQHPWITRDFSEGI